MLASRLWHPFRVPLLHRPEIIAQLAGELDAAWSEMLEQHRQIEDDDFYYPQITKLLELFQHAARRSEAVLSFLDKPADDKRARKVEIPDLRVSQ